MARRLDELVAVFAGEIEIDVHRVSAPHHGKSQFRGILNYTNGSGIVYQGVLDLLVDSEQADVIFDTRYVTSVRADGFSELDEIPVVYISEHGEQMPIQIVSIGKRVVQHKDEQIREEKEKKQTIHYTLIPEREGVLYRLEKCAVVTRDVLEKAGFSENSARNKIENCKNHPFLRYNAVVSGKVKTHVIVPYDAQKQVFGVKEIEESIFSDVYVVPRTKLEEYCQTEHITFSHETKVPEVTIDDVAYVPASWFDAFKTKIRSQRGKSKKVREETSSIQYTLEERELVTVVKDVAELDKINLWIKTGMKSKEYAGHVLRRETERQGFAEYRASNKQGGCPRRISLIPRGSEERIYKGVTLDTFRDLELIKTENVEKYVLQYIADKNEGVEQKIEKSPIVRFADGTTYHLKESIDTIIKEAGVNITKEKITKKKKERKNKSPKKRSSGDNVINVHEYEPLGKISDDTYMYDERSAALFDNGRQKLVKYGEIFNPFTPEDLTGVARSRYQHAMRNCILKTTAAKDRRDENGNPVPETEVGRGKKHYLETRVANLCIMYLVDNGFTRPPKVG